MSSARTRASESRLSGFLSVRFAGEKGTRPSRPLFYHLYVTRTVGAWPFMALELAMEYR